MQISSLNKQQLDIFVSSQPHSQFLQSYTWGEFQKNAGHKIWRFGVSNNEKLIASASIIEHHLPLGKSYLYCPRGPMVDNNLNNKQKNKTLKLILSKARDLTIKTKQKEEIFFRLEPTFGFQISNFEFIPTTTIQPPNTLILNLSPLTNDLLSSMHQKTRYNIKLAEKHGVTIKKVSAEEFDQVWPLYKQTSQRDKFNLHPKSYYQKMLKTLTEVELWVAYNKDNVIICANLISFFGDTVTYLHGASNYNFRQLMSPHLLQWQIIQEAKDRGFKYYDFHGIAPNDNQKHPWFGVTRFKKGFGGQTIDYPGTFDFIYEKSWYKIYKIIRTLNKLRR